MLRIATALTTESIRHDHALRHSIAIIIDVFRATTTMCAALHSGAYRIVPIEEEYAARALAATMRSEHRTENILLCGERGGLKPLGFDLGNSPLEYTPEHVAHSTLILTTTNGTRAIHRTHFAAVQLVLGFVNMNAVVRYISHLLQPSPRRQPSTIQQIYFVCAGTEGAPALEDTLCAGACIDALLAENPSFQPDEISFAAFKEYASLDGQAALHHALHHTPHAQRLRALGFERDIAFASEPNSLPIVPCVYHDDNDGDYIHLAHTI